MIWAGSPGVMWRRAKSVRATTPMTGMVATIRLRISGSTSADQPSGTTAVAHRLHLDIPQEDRKSTRLNSSHGYISYAVFCLKKKKINIYLFSSSQKKQHITT